MKKIINKIKNILKNNKTIFENFTYLGILQFVRIIVPLIMLPYLVKVLGIETYGIVIFAQAVVFYFMVLVNFGFEMSATKQISINRNDVKKLSEIVSAVLTIKTILFILSGSLYVLLTFAVPKMNDYSLLFLLSYLFCIQEILIPVWFFQGIEKMKFITIIDVISRATFLILIFSFVHNKDDYLLIPLLRFIGIIIAGVVSIYLMFVREKIQLKIVPMEKIIYYFKDSLPFFFSKFTIAINDRTNTLLIGSFLGMSSVAYYDFVYKVIGAINSIFGTFVRAIYPHVAHTKNLIKIKKILYFNTISSSICYLLLCLFSKKIILLLVGENLLPAQPLFYTLGLLLPLVAIGWSLGDLNLAANGFNKIYSLSSIHSTIFYLIIVVCLYLFNLINVNYLIFALLLRVLFIVIYRYYYCMKYQLIG
ncbi:MAG: oligosaccharide flippase family protein [Candidatus Cloacimonetes bacterium]|nr:oligosaccharide flippase family protein [Candidatus Cloacimonadota bacterium]